MSETTTGGVQKDLRAALEHAKDALDDARDGIQHALDGLAAAANPTTPTIGGPISAGGHSSSTTPTPATGTTDTAPGTTEAGTQSAAATDAPSSDRVAELVGQGLSQQDAEAQAEYEAKTAADAAQQ